ncbi:MerR family transcriptional regulator [Brevibacillus thermoruber]|uniref:MerR family transcriptional regulator n=1 Tax=Brevibacillus thermoruber TaxID=33942 RepID=UPI0003F5A2CD|nr:MerR family transcriptional regulator [Brevibacillus thermoruber]
MLYTVKEVSELTNVTIKTLHHYHKIGLLTPCAISEAGYRLYGMKELERLQQILFYRELDIPLKKIKQLLDDERDRVTILAEQKKLLLARARRLERLLETLDESLDCAKKGKVMEKTKMFKGFEDENEWKEALGEQNQYLKEKYGVDILKNQTIDVQAMNEKAMDAQRFLQGMANALKTGLRYDDRRVWRLIRRHLDDLQRHGHAISPANFAAQARFFLDDEFHRQMLESLQNGLAYYLCIAAESFAKIRDAKEAKTSKGTV